MKRLLITLFLLLSLSVVAQESKPRVFVHGRGTVNAMTQGGSGAGFFSNGTLFSGSRHDSIVDTHDESIELTKELRQRCDGVIVTLKEDTADYLVMLNRESKAKKGVFNKNNQVLVADKNGDVIWTKDVRAVASAAKDVCSAVTTAYKSAPHAAVTPPQPSASKSATAPAATPAPKQDAQQAPVSGDCIAQTSTGGCKR